MGGNTRAVGVPVVGFVPQAAMEPPGNGRKHLLLLEKVTGLLSAPQWSRPVMGGNTPDPDSAAQRDGRAAMEPPGNGRKHFWVAVVFVAVVVPQWSRPVMGGNTWPYRCPCAAPGSRNGAAR